MTYDDAWEVRALPLGDPGESVVEIVVSGPLCHWIEQAARDGAAASGRWRSLGEGRVAVVLRLGEVDVDAVLSRDGDEYVGRAAARTHRLDD